MNGNWKKQVKAKVTIERGWGEGAGGGRVREVRLCHDKTYLIRFGGSIAF